MTNILIQEGNLLDSNAKYIAHQTNCVSTGSAHLAAALFAKYPYANVYRPRLNGAQPSEPGTIVIAGDGTENRFVIAMMAQYYPGKSKFPESNLDGVLARKKHFFQCLKHIALIPELNSIAFPYGIGCGAAGGTWQDYLALLEKFAKHVADKATVSLVKLGHQ